jgi:hypothetical protein
MPKSPPPPEFDVPLIDIKSGRITAVWWEWLQRYVRWDQDCCDAASEGSEGGIPDAPDDGLSYARNSLEWKTIVPADTIVTEAPIDGNLYNRIDADWQIATFVEQAGDTMTGPLILSGNPVLPLEAAPKQYVDLKPPLLHTHPESDIVNLVPDLAGKAALVHTHTESQITGLVADLALKAPLANPGFTGNPTAPTAAPGDNDTSLATTAFVTAAIAAIPPTGLSTAEYTYSTTPGVPPSSGQLRTNNPVPQTGITQFYLHYTNAQTTDIRNALRLIKAPNTVLVQDKTNAVNHHYFEVTGDAVDNGTYFTIPVTWTSGGPNFTAGRVIFAVFGLGS